MLLVPSNRRGQHYHWAGLLALGSTYSPHLPASLEYNAVALAAFVPDYSGGTAPGLHGIPY